MKRDWLFDPAEVLQFSPYRPAHVAFHSDYSVSPPNNKISRLNHRVTPLPRCLRFTPCITAYSTRLANGGWLDLTVQDSHLLDYPPLAGRTIRIYFHSFLIQCRVIQNHHRLLSFANNGNQEYILMHDVLENLHPIKEQKQILFYNHTLMVRICLYWYEKTLLLLRTVC